MEVAPKRSGRQEIIKLNIGGYRFETTRGTIEDFGGDFLNRLVEKNCNKDRDEGGYLFVDRPKQEAKLIDYFLRTSKVPPCFNPYIVEDAKEYFGIAAMNPSQSAQRQWTIHSNKKTSCPECKGAPANIEHRFVAVQHLLEHHDATIYAYYASYYGEIYILYSVPIEY
jgi:hypothetical protein